MRPESNIWIAAGDGDLDRVRVLVEEQSISPNAPDPYTYTPMHAAASYGQLHVLDYLLAHGGNINVTDDENDTPLYTVENIDTARYLVEHGAVVDRRNNEGVSPIEHLMEEFPDVANYLQSLSQTSATTAPPAGTASHSQPSQHLQNVASETLTSSLMQTVGDIMARAEAEGRDPDEELRQAVSRTVLDGVLTGYEMSEGTGEERTRESDADPSPKRSRTNGSG